MNKQLIEKAITSNNLPCPEFTFENPLLDKNVAEALSKSFVNILKISDNSSKLNDNMRLSILEKIKKMCITEPENHIKLDENTTSYLLQTYEENINKSDIRPQDCAKKTADEFLIKYLTEMEISSNFKPSVDPEIIQAFINLNEDPARLKAAYKDIIHWNSTDKKSVHILKHLFTKGTCMLDDVTIKLKAEIERELIIMCHSLLNETQCIEELFTSHSALRTIVLRSSESANCFQMSCNIINYIFIMTNFAAKIQMFVQSFVERVKNITTLISISLLYPIHLSNVILVIDFDLDILPASVRDLFVQEGLKHLSSIKAEKDLIMLLSHYPQWFDIYHNRDSIMETD